MPPSILSRAVFRGLEGDNLKKTHQVFFCTRAGTPSRRRVLLFVSIFVVTAVHFCSKQQPTVPTVLRPPLVFLGGAFDGPRQADEWCHSPLRVFFLFGQGEVRFRGGRCVSDGAAKHHQAIERDQERAAERQACAEVRIICVPAGGAGKGEGAQRAFCLRKIDVHSHASISTT